MKQLGLAALIFCIWTAGAEAEDVDLELVLAVDGSGSVKSGARVPMSSIVEGVSAMSLRTPG